MSAEQSAEQQKRVPQTPADKTDAPKRVRETSVQMLETDDYFCVTPDTPLAEAIEQMKRDEGGCVIVCEEERVVGIFTERIPDPDRQRRGDLDARFAGCRPR